VIHVKIDGYGIESDVFLLLECDWPYPVTKRGFLRRWREFHTTCHPAPLQKSLVRCHRRSLSQGAHM
jgi:hypothetical protein